MFAMPFPLRDENTQFSDNALPRATTLGPGIQWGRQVSKDLPSGRLPSSLWHCRDAGSRSGPDLALYFFWCSILPRQLERTIAP